MREVLHAGARFLRAAVKRALYRGAARLRYWKYISWYGESVAEPYELIHINPSDVERRVYPYFEEGLSEYGTYIVGGNWDRGHQDYTLGYTLEEHRLVVPLKESLFFGSVEKWMAGECEWEETEFYRCDAANKSAATAAERRKKLSALRTEIAAGNYLSQQELKRSGEDETSP